MIITKQHADHCDDSSAENGRLGGRPVAVPRPGVVAAIEMVGVAIDAYGYKTPSKEIAEAISEGYEALEGDDQDAIDKAIQAARQALGGGRWQPGLRPTSAELAAAAARFE